MNRWHERSLALLAAVSGALLSLGLASRVEALPPQSDIIESVAVTATTGEKPQSKVWKYDGYWWSVLPNASGTHVRRLDGSRGRTC